MGGRPLLQPKLGFTPYIGRIDSAFLKKRNLSSSGLFGLTKGVGEEAIGANSPERNKTPADQPDAR